MQRATILRSVVILAATVSTLVFGLPQAAADEGASPGAKQIRAVTVPDARLETRLDALQKEIPEAVFEEVPLDQVLEWMATLTPMQILPLWKTLENAGIERDKPITMTVRGVKFYQLLWLVLKEASGPDLDLGYEVHGERLLVVSTFEDFEREQFLRIYDVRVLLDGNVAWHERQAQRKAHQSSVASVSRPPTGVPQKAAAREARSEYGSDDSAEEELRELVIYSVRPDSWVENGGRGTAQCFNGMLVARQSRSVHREIEALLSALLEAGATEIEPQ